MMRIAIGIEYRGSDYCGWQKQLNLPSIQESLEAALSKVAHHEIKLFCAGRTDVGVHALGQVAHFDTTAVRLVDAWVLGGNTNLPSSIKIKWAREVSEDFHARFSATARHYRYFIYNGRIQPGIFHGLVSFHPFDLQENLMQEASAHLLGEQDFSSFRGSGCQSRSPNRCIELIYVKRAGKILTIDIKANAFLLHMVRNIVGALCEVGEGRKAPEWIKQILVAKSRSAASITAKSHGLYFLKVDYPYEFNLPDDANNLNFAINIE